MNKITNMAGLAVSYLALSALKLYEKNARTHSRKQIGQAAVIWQMGFNVPILIDENNTVLAGKPGEASDYSVCTTWAVPGAMSTVFST